MLLRAYAFFHRNREIAVVERGRFSYLNGTLMSVRRSLRHEKAMCAMIRT